MSFLGTKEFLNTISSNLVGATRELVDLEKDLGHRGAALSQIHKSI